MIKKIRLKLERYYVYLFLLPIYFVLHSYMQYYGLAPVATALKLVIEVTAAVTIFFSHF